MRTIFSCRNAVSLITCFLLCTMFGYSQLSTSTSGVNSYRIAGVVVSALSGTPLARARVTIADTIDREKTLSVVTSDDGHFEFTQLGRGKYSVHAAKRGFIARDYMAHEQFSTAIVTGAGLDTEHLVFRLAPYAIISGKVLDESGDPVRHAIVGLFRENHGLGESRIVRFRSHDTDDQGAFEFNNLDSGTYFISARATPWYAVHPSARRKPDGSTATTSVDPFLDVAYPITYYADATDPDDATPIPLQGGDHPEVEIHLNAVPSIHVQFQVPDGGFSVPTLKQRSFDGMEQINSSTQQGSNGVFEISGIAPGRYSVQMPAASQPGQAAQTSELDVDLTADNEKLDSVRGEPSGTVKATVQIEGETAVPAHLSILLQNSKLHEAAWREVDEKGQVVFENIVPGTYEVLAQGAGKRYSVVRLSSSGSQTDGHNLNVAASSSLAISVLLVAGSARIEGVAQRAGKPMAGVMVVLTPQKPEANRPLFRRDQSDLDGSFALQNVIPGTYSICAIENGWDLDWAKPAVIAHYCDHGERVTVRSGVQGTMRLQRPVEVQSP